MLCTRFRSFPCISLLLTSDNAIGVPNSATVGPRRDFPFPNAPFQAVC
jgi:hypothetical protein